MTCGLFATSPLRSTTTIVLATPASAFSARPSRWHLAASRLRATETGRAVVRATNDGISALIGPSGQLLGTLPEDAADTLTATLPLHDHLTPFVRFGPWPGALLALIGKFFLG